MAEVRVDLFVFRSHPHIRTSDLSVFTGERPLLPLALRLEADKSARGGGWETCAVLPHFSAPLVVRGHAVTPSCSL